LLGSTNNLCNDLASASVRVALPRILLPGTSNTNVETLSKFCSASSLNEGLAPFSTTTTSSIFTLAAGPNFLESISLVVAGSSLSAGSATSSAAICLASGASVLSVINLLGSRPAALYISALRWPILPKKVLTSPSDSLYSSTKDFFLPGKVKSTMPGVAMSVTACNNLSDSISPISLLKPKRPNIRPEFSWIKSFAASMSPPFAFCINSLFRKGCEAFEVVSCVGSAVSTTSLTISSSIAGVVSSVATANKPLAPSVATFLCALLNALPLPRVSL